MVEIEIISFPTGTTMFKNSANDAIATLDKHGVFTFQYEPEGRRPINVTCPILTTDLDILRDAYYKTGLIKHTNLVEADFLPIGHGGKRDGAGRPRSDEPKNPYRITKEEKALIIRLRNIGNTTNVQYSSLLKMLNQRLDDLEGNT
ncbi:hypothetical protein [Pseudoalteromonas maricaloris]|uniref:hypothetical protein n=1 Tax=Pseudoalteromonas maricaloris TaxID=184924 RepID=UPI00057E5791|nr:hypothetical protein [Pseudoalteromonas flavipulchra]KID34839.1 hypothetical protein QT15_17250 [Pseudoalteromonas flavipulchra NCIMB 2033 = ATCC BAA-314]MBD0784061.1 hypothetical protein [Pseudoalteromonas flavipulchra]MBE0372887.1 hypothetical protein [Pseudoalteromonas flavipulchra NCIMB 2033 = ATCC BAA-314]